ncbi:hypothetical protein IFM89_023596 [Coptis chinensis]|uniref:Uncharacterized protein n=1 Tax=Coptis chinensis TaxID=261450 RepID=A0A835HGK9_9MAGN|nr:hypothetical protein IFM89_023596 [Coptis chinensis]
MPVPCIREIRFLVGAQRKRERSSSASPGTKASAGRLGEAGESASPSTREGEAAQERGKKKFCIGVVRLEQEGSSYNFGYYKKKGVYPSPLVSFHFRRSGTHLEGGAHDIDSNPLTSRCISEIHHNMCICLFFLGNLQVQEASSVQWVPSLQQFCSLGLKMFQPCNQLWLCNGQCFTEKELLGCILLYHMCLHK